MLSGNELKESAIGNDFKESAIEFCKDLAAFPKSAAKRFMQYDKTSRFEIVRCFANGAVNGYLATNKNIPYLGAAVGVAIVGALVMGKWAIGKAEKLQHENIDFKELVGNINSTKTEVDLLESTADDTVNEVLKLAERYKIIKQAVEEVDEKTDDALKAKFRTTVINEALADFEKQLPKNMGNNAKAKKKQEFRVAFTKKNKLIDDLVRQKIKNFHQQQRFNEINKELALQNSTESKVDKSNDDENNTQQTSSVTAKIKTFLTEAASTFLGIAPIVYVVSSSITGESFSHVSVITPTITISVVGGLAGGYKLGKESHKKRLQRELEQFLAKANYKIVKKTLQEVTNRLNEANNLLKKLNGVKKPNIDTKKQSIMQVMVEKVDEPENKESNLIGVDNGAADESGFLNKVATFFKCGKITDTVKPYKIEVAKVAENFTDINTREPTPSNSSTSNQSKQVSRGSVVIEIQTNLNAPSSPVNKAEAYVPINNIAPNINSVNPVNQIPDSPLNAVNQNVTNGLPAISENKVINLSNRGVSKSVDKPQPLVRERSNTDNLVQVHPINQPINLQGNRTNTRNSFYKSPERNNNANNNIIINSKKVVVLRNSTRRF